jgi:hypothetical protein
VSTFDQALKEFFENGGKVQTLDYRGPKESDAISTHMSRNVSRESVVEKELDAMLEDIVALEDLTGL